MYHWLSRSTGQRSRSQHDIAFQLKQYTNIQARSCQRSNLVKIIPQLSATHYTAFKVVRLNIECAIILLRIARPHSNLVQSFNTSHAIRCKCSRSQHSVSAAKMLYIIRQWIGSAIITFSSFYCFVGWLKMGQLWPYSLQVLPLPVCSSLMCYWVLNSRYTLVVGGVQRADWERWFQSCDLREPPVWCRGNPLWLQTLIAVTTLLTDTDWVTISTTSHMP